ncbi:protein ALP1-like [Coffea eugenioides]|uniref:protein ALP1-like n=1 Tax=Coffea eugenioides TaxID=49369 RepID=UPI000F60A329|nr:protein ALP1-like [Coffea eugenioides]
MPRLRRRALKGLQKDPSRSTSTAESACGENDLQLCITNYCRDNLTPFHGMNLADHSDDELIFLAFLLLGLALFDPLLHIPRRRYRDSALSRQQWVIELINGHRDRIFENLRMDVPLFLHLCNLLVEQNYWQQHPTLRVGIHESKAIALVCLSHNECHRLLSEHFKHSPETVDQLVRRCLRALVRLGRDIIRPRNYNETHPRILNSEMFYPWFKDCVGAIGGTHISAWFTAENRTITRKRRRDLSQHVLAACDHDMRFVYVQCDWEGSAQDARVLQEALVAPESNFPMPPVDKYFLVDATYTNMPGFIAPFRPARGTVQARATKSLFNRRQASLRSVIERSFDVLKMRFPILKGPMQNYLIATQNNIVFACCALHNFMREKVSNDDYFAAGAAAGAIEIEDAYEDGYQVPGLQQINMSQQNMAEWNEVCRAMADHMYLHRHY